MKDHQTLNAYGSKRRVLRNVDTKPTGDAYKAAYRAALETLKPFDGMCPRDCSHCEEREVLILLPGEEELMSGNLRAGNLLTLLEVSSSKDLPCPAQCSFTKSCDIYPNRPIDCRSFPVVLAFESDGNLTTRISSSYCPIAESLPLGFRNAVELAWKSLLPYLPEDWKRKYNKTPCSV